MKREQRTPSETIRLMLVSALLRQFGSYLGHFDIAG